MQTVIEMKRAMYWILLSTKSTGKELNIYT